MPSASPRSAAAAQHVEALWKRQTAADRSRLARFIAPGPH
jgi:hypothetical protein